jgi:hypothetical protein
MRSFLLRVCVGACTLLPLHHLSAAPPVPADAPIGLLSKVILEVLRKESGKTWENAMRGQTLGSGDMVRTGPKSLAIIKFKDNSLVRLRERSELTVTGTITGGAFYKAVEVQTGVVGFNVQKQRSGEEFRFTSPTSVASIRGTAGMFTAKTMSDTLMVTEGSVFYTNRVSNKSVDVLSGFTGISNRDGTIQTRRSTESERRAALEAQQDDQRKKLEIELRDPQGKTNRLKIEYRD